MICQFIVYFYFWIQIQELFTKNRKILYYQMVRKLDIIIKKWFFIIMIKLPQISLIIKEIWSKGCRWPVGQPKTGGRESKFSDRTTKKYFRVVGHFFDTYLKFFGGCGLILSNSNNLNTWPNSNFMVLKNKESKKTINLFILSSNHRLIPTCLLSPV